MMLVAIVPLWVVVLAFAVNAVLAIEEVTEEKTGWRANKSPPILQELSDRLDAALARKTP